MAASSCSTSAAPDVVPGDGNGVEDIFVKDRQTNAIVRVSAGPGGVDAAGTHSHATIFKRGRAARRVLLDGQHAHRG